MEFLLPLQRRLRSLWGQIVEEDNGSWSEAGEDTPGKPCNLFIAPVKGAAVEAYGSKLFFFEHRLETRACDSSGWSKDQRPDGMLCQYFLSLANISAQPFCTA